MPVATAADLPGRGSASRTTPWYGVAGGAGLLLGVIAYVVLDATYLSGAEAATIVAISWALLGVGLMEWSRRPASDTGPLLALFAASGLLSSWQASTATAAFTAGYMLSAVPPLVLAHLLLSYPDGRLHDGIDRLAITAAYAAVVPIPTLQLLVYDPAQHDAGINSCRTSCPDSLLALAPDPGLFRALAIAQIVIYSAVAVVLTASVVRHFWHLPSRSRLLVGALIVVALLVTVRVTAGNVLYASGDAQDHERILFWTSAGTMLAVAVVLVIGLLRRGLAQAAVADLVVELERSRPFEVEGALARAVGDPSLRVALWLPERERYVDANGSPVELPAGHGARAVTFLRGEDAPLAAVIHDRALAEQPGLIEAGAAAARLALQNAQLQAEVRAQLAEVERSRMRLVGAADTERRRVERDIHDGAQQRLVALALSLRVAERKLGTADSPEIERVLSTAVSELKRAVGELRELARGVYPAILAEEGLTSAIESLAARTPLKVTVEGRLDDRPPSAVETAAYFVACEALANAAKHAEASSVAITIDYDGTLLRIAVADDGQGGAAPSAGSGLTGLVDRVEAHGGRLEVRSAAGQGTTVLAEIPCAR